jgi:hypothetical protein
MELLAIAILAAACTQSSEPVTGRSGSAGGLPNTTAVSLLEPTGPLAGLTWPAASVPVGLLLHDDGRRLWAVPLNGRPKLLWEHPRAHVYEIAAGPDGDQLAYSVMLPGRTADAPSFVLYLLDSDGSVRTVDVVRNYLSIETPVFLRAPTDLDGPVRLYWIRGGQEVSTATGRPQGQVMVLGPQGPLRVTVPVRYEEAPFEIHGYPGGSWTFSLTLSRNNDVPTRLEILMNDDVSGSAGNASLTLWGDMERPVNTDIFTGVAWITPTEYVIPVAQRAYPDDYSLRLFRVGCEYLGSHVVYRGTGIDWGYAEYPWPILPGGEDRVLVIGASEARRVVAGKAKTAPWLAVDVITGKIVRTQAMWSPPGKLSGWWTFVQPAEKVPSPTKAPDCSDVTWTYP